VLACHAQPKNSSVFPSNTKIATEKRAYSTFNLPYLLEFNPRGFALTGAADIDSNRVVPWLRAHVSQVRRTTSSIHYYSHVALVCRVSTLRFGRAVLRLCREQATGKHDIARPALHQRVRLSEHREVFDSVDRHVAARRRPRCRRASSVDRHVAARRRPRCRRASETSRWWVVRQVKLKVPGLLVESLDCISLWPCPVNEETPNLPIENARKKVEFPPVSW
jgi:hypothetical protein